MQPKVAIQQQLRTLAEALLVLAAGAGALLARRDAFGFWDDEGINLQKALMVAEGVPLYREMFSDQAPLYTWLLVPLHRVLGGEYQAMRAVALVFGALLLAAGYALARWISGGRLAGVICLVVLAAAAPVQKFASSLVIPIPALALGAWSTYVALRASRAGDPARAAAASGVLLGLACMIKLAFAYFVPLVLVALLSGQLARRPRVALSWLAGLVAPVLVVALVADPRAMASQLIDSHLDALEAVSAARAAEARRFLLWAPGWPWLYGAGALGLAVLAATGRRRAAAVLALWLGIVSAWMVMHRPLYGHHLPELLFPLAVALAAGIGVAAPALQAAWAGRAVELARAAGALLVAFGLMKHLGSYPAWQRYHDNTSLAAMRPVARLLAERTAPSDVVLVDRPILAYLAGRKTPPDITMVSDKRILAGALTDAELTHALDELQPAAVALCSARFSRFRSFNAALAASYRVVDDRRVPSPHGTRPVRCRVLVRPAAAANR